MADDVNRIDPRGPMRRVLPAALLAVAAAVVAHLAGVASIMTVLIGVLAAGAVGGFLVLRADRRALHRGGALPVTARVDLAGAIGAVFPVFTAWVTANVLLNVDIYGTAYNPTLTSHFSPALVLLLVVLLGLTGHLVVRRAPLTLPRAPRLPVVLAIVLVALLGVKLAIAWGLVKIPAFDSGIVLLAAYHTVFPAATDNPFDAGLFEFYFGIYPNNLVFAQFFSIVFSAAAALGVTGVQAFMEIAIAINCIALTVVELLTFLTVRRLWSTRTAWFALAITAVFTTVSPWIATPYSDTIGMLFPIGLLYGWLRLRAEHRPRRRLVLAVVLGAVAAIGLQVKPTVLFAIVAIVLVEAVRSRRALRRRATAITAATLAGLALVSGVGVSLGLTAAVNSSSLTGFDVWRNDQAVPITHFMKMGSTGTGGFAYEDVLSTLAEPPKQRAGAALKVYEDRVAAMGPEGYTIFLAKKALRTFADGSFYLGQEGENVPDFFWSTQYSDKVRQWYLRDGRDHVYLASIWQAAWLLLLLAASLPVARFAPPSRRRAIDTARIAMLGLLVFLMVFETRFPLPGALHPPSSSCWRSGCSTRCPPRVAALRSRVPGRAVAAPWSGDPVAPAGGLRPPPPERRSSARYVLIGQCSGRCGRRRDTRTRTEDHFAGSAARCAACLERGPRTSAYRVLDRPDRSGCPG